MVAAAASFALMGVHVKALRRLPVWEITFTRAAINLLWLLPWALKNPRLIGQWRREPRALLLRGVSGAVAVAMYFYAIQHIRLADAAMLNHSAPLLVLILSAAFLGERLRPLAVGFTLVAFAGIALILKPAVDLATGPERWGAAAGLASAFTAAVAYVSIKVATRTLAPRLIVFTFAGITAALSLVPALFTLARPLGFEWLHLVGAGLFASIAQDCMTRGYASLPASVASPFLTLTVPLAAAAAWIVWGELPDAWSAAGAMLVIGGLWGAYRSRQRPVAHEPAQTGT